MICTAFLEAGHDDAIPWAQSHRSLVPLLRHHTLSFCQQACGISSSPSNAAFVVSPAAVSTDHDCAASRFLLLGGSSPSTDHSKRCTSTEALSGVRSNPRAKRQVSNVVGRMSSVTTTGGDGGSVGVASDTAAGEGGEDKKKRRDATKSVLLGVFGEVRALDITNKHYRNVNPPCLRFVNPPL